MSKKILILVGTGAMGIYVTQYASQMPGCQVFVTSRSARPSAENVNYLCGNAHDISFLQQTLKQIKPDAVIDFMLWTTKEFETVCPVFLANTSQYLFVSSYRVFAEQNPLTENSPRLLDVCKDSAYLQTDEYALAKARQENILRQSGKTNWTIVRPSITFSTYRFQLGCLEASTVCFRSLHNLPVPIPSEMLDKQTTLTWAGDVAVLLCRLLFNPQAYGEDFNVVTAEHHTWREIAGYYHKFIGTKIQEISLQDYIDMLGVPWQTKYDRMFDRILDNRKVLAATGIKQTDFTTLEEGLKKELEQFMKKPKLTPNMILNARMDRLSNTKTPLSNQTFANRVRYYLARYPKLEYLIPRKFIKNIVGRIKKK